MNPDLLASIIAYMRTSQTLVTAFGDNAATPKFWSNYNAFQSSATDPVMPYLVFVEPNETKSYETADATGSPSDAAIGMLICDIYASTEIGVRQLGEMLCGVLNDCDGTIQGLFYFRRTTQAMPPLPSTGPDASPTIFRRQIQYKYMYEDTFV